MADLVLPIACFAAGAGTALLLDRKWPRQRFRHMAHDLERALRLDAFEMHYQPIVKLRDRRWMGFEALLRWRARNGTLISPELFLPVAAEAELMQPLSERVVDLVGRDLAHLLRRRPDLHVGINVPPDLLGRGEFAEVAERSGMGALASQVIIEITETGIVDDISRQGVAAARALGARVAIDDFGTGLNGLAQLQDLQIDYIKIDKIFVRKIGSPSPGAKLVDAIVTIARDIGAETIAEGVETEAQLRYLQHLGVEMGQGWLFSKPLPIREVHARLAA